MPTKSLEGIVFHQASISFSGNYWSGRPCVKYARAIARQIPRIAYALVASIVVLNTPSTQAQDTSGQSASKRLEQEKPNEFRGAKQVNGMEKAKENMKMLFEKILISGSGDGKADEWYSPHLRDLNESYDNKVKEATIRGKTSPGPMMFLICLFGNGTIEAACPVRSILPFMGGKPGCNWHGVESAPDHRSHRPWASCFTRSTQRYEQFKKPSNFKMCCVKEGIEERATSEYIASMHPNGEGWAGLFEYYYPTLALGWENDRTTTMIVDKNKVQQCVAQSKDLMDRQAPEWVSGAIKRNLKAAGEAEGSNAANVRQTIQDALKDIHPKDEKLRFTDSLQSEGLTLRVNLAAMDPEQRKKTAKRFCMRPEQFDKLMDPAHDPLQRGGGPDLQSLDNIPVWSNYCPQGVELMTNPDNSQKLRNLDGTPTKFDEGMRAWKTDPMYCQKMNLTNPNMFIMGFATAVMKGGGGIQSQRAVGYTCLEGGKLNGSMVPVELYRHAAVERRTAITDHALGFLIAGGLAPGMIEGKKSYYKRFEPQPYSNLMPEHLKTFTGVRFGGGDTNEIGESCPGLSGENLSGQTKSDRLFISDKTHQAFDQEKVEAVGKNGDFNRYRQEWAKDPQTGEKIAARGLDKDSQNYAAPFRIFATCPKGFKRWRPPEDPENHGLIINLNQHCQEENFGGDTPPGQ